MVLTNESLSHVNTNISPQDLWAAKDVHPEGDDIGAGASFSVHDEVKLATSLQ